MLHVPGLSVACRPSSLAWAKRCSAPPATVGSSFASPSIHQLVRGLVLEDIADTKPEPILVLFAPEGVYHAVVDDGSGVERKAARQAATRADVVDAGIVRVN